MYRMFYYCSSLTSLNLSNFNTNNVKEMSRMFFHCSSLTSLNLSILILKMLIIWVVCSLTVLLYLH